MDITCQCISYRMHNLDFCLSQQSLIKKTSNRPDILAPFPKIPELLLGSPWCVRGCLCYRYDNECIEDLVKPILVLQNHCPPRARERITSVISF